MKWINGGLLNGYPEAMAILNLADHTMFAPRLCGTEGSAPGRSERGVGLCQLPDGAAVEGDGTGAGKQYDETRPF